MAKGQTNLPLTIVVHNSLLSAEQWQDLKDKGHTILSYDEAAAAGVTFDQADLILGPNCSWFTPPMILYLETTIKRARKARRERKKGE